MAETLATLIDKLSIINLKIWHCQEALFKPKADTIDSNETARLRAKNESLLGQRQWLIQEIDDYFFQAVTKPENVLLTNPQNKIYGQFRKEEKL